MPVEGQVYDLEVSARLGPWSKGERHPGLVVSQPLIAGTDAPFVVVPMTGSQPRFARVTHVLLEGVHGSITGPMWIECEYPTTLSAADFDPKSLRGSVSKEIRAQVKQKLAWLLKLPLTATKT